MNTSFALKIFAVVAPVVYMGAFINGYTPVRWYPLLGEASMSDLPRSAGPAMGWYSWIVVCSTAGSVAGAIALVVPKSLTERIGPTIS